MFFPHLPHYSEDDHSFDQRISVLGDERSANEHFCSDNEFRQDAINVPPACENYHDKNDFNPQTQRHGTVGFPEVIISGRKCTPNSTPKTQTKDHQPGGDSDDIVSRLSRRAVDKEQSQLVKQPPKKRSKKTRDDGDPPELQEQQ